MADWYTDHLYKIYEAKFHEKFFRKSPLPQWVGWYNRYNESFNYEVYNSYLGVYVKRMIPKRFPYVTEFSFIDNNDFLNTGLCIYRQANKIYWFKIILGDPTSDDRDDVMWTEPVEYTEITNAYYVYVHDVKFPWNSTRLAYLFVVEGLVRVFALDTANPGILYEADMSEVNNWCADLCDSPDVFIRLSKTALELPGYHKAFYMDGNDVIPTYGMTRIFSITTQYNEEADTLMFKSNIAGDLWWRNRPYNDDFPSMDSVDPDDRYFSLLPYKYIGTWASGVSYNLNEVVFYDTYNYVATEAHTSSSLNSPDISASPWTQLSYYLTPLGTDGYGYGFGTIATDELPYSYVNWISDADREWLTGSNLIVVRVGGGFAYILLA